MKVGLIADIQRASFHDGTGIRTTVFFKGCPLSCKWCHNPECISNQPQTLFYPDKCIGCGMCDKGCYAGARVICGKEMTSQEVLEHVMQDILYYRGGGGVTFSGGEPFLQKEFLKECIMLCREHGIGCAVETSMFFFDEEIFSMLDFVMADLKVWDSHLHRQYTGVGNEIILENFQYLIFAKENLGHLIYIMVGNSYFTHSYQKIICITVLDSTNMPDSKWKGVKMEE